jgi:hypothetical protein
VAGLAHVAIENLRIGLAQIDDLEGVARTLMSAKSLRQR